MGWFRKTKKATGWMAFCLHQDGVRTVQIDGSSAAGRPVVRSAAFYASDKQALSELLEKMGKDLRASDFQCSTVLAPSEYQLLSVDAPNVPPDELKTAIRWRLKDMLDFHIDDATIDVLDVPTDKAAASRNHSMYAVAARNQLIAQRQTLFGDARIPLSVIDIPEMAQRNISSLLEPEGRGLAFLSFSPDGGLLTVTYGGELYLSRRIDVPTASLEQDDTEQRNASFDRVTLELQRSLDHFDRQYHFIAVAKLVVAPLAGAAKLITDYLSRNLYVPVEALDISTVVDIASAPELASPEAQQRFLTSLGAALRHEEKAL